MEAPVVDGGSGSGGGLSIVSRQGDVEGLTNADTQVGRAADRRKRCMVIASSLLLLKHSREDGLSVDQFTAYV
jgi:hypothetical protein